MVNFHLSARELPLELRWATLPEHKAGVLAHDNPRHGTTKQELCNSRRTGVVLTVRGTSVQEADLNTNAFFINN